MIIDLTRRPIMTLLDEVPSSVVVRSIGNRSVNGAVTFRYERTREKTDIIDVPPTASWLRPETACYETRLPLPGTRMKAGMPSPYQPAPFRVYQMARSLPPRAIRPPPNYDDLLSEDSGSADPVQPEQQSSPILPDPFEVASVYLDRLTGYQGSGRFAIQIEKHRKMWLVTVSDLTSGHIFTVGARDLRPNPDDSEVMPINRKIRAQAGQGPRTAWDRLLDGEDED